MNAEMSDFAIPHGGSMPDWQAAVCKIDVRTYGFTMFPNSIQPTYEVTVSSKIPTQAVVVPSIAACVIYHDAVTGKIHHTPLGFQLMKIPRRGVSMLRDCDEESSTAVQRNYDAPLDPWQLAPRLTKLEQSMGKAKTPIAQRP